MAKEMGPGHTIVTILADYGTRYQSKLFNPQFLIQKPAGPALACREAAADHRAVREMNMPLPSSPPIGSRAAERAGHLHRRRLVVSAASRPRRESGVRSAHISGAVFFDIDDLSDETNPSPHMLAPAAKFAGRMTRLGLGSDNRIVVYDGVGLFSSPRAWWMLRAMGHRNVFVLDGGLPKWRREGWRGPDAP